MADIKVALRLDTTQLKADLAQAAKDIKSAMSGGGGSSGGGVGGGGGGSQPKAPTALQAAKLAHVNAINSIRQQNAANAQAHQATMQAYAQSYKLVLNGLSTQNAQARSAHQATMQAMGQTQRTNLNNIQNARARQGLVHQATMQSVGQSSASARAAHQLVMQGIQVTTANARQQLAALRLQRAKANPPASGMSQFARNIGFAAMPAFNPTSPLALLGSFRQSMAAFETPFGVRMRGAMGRGLAAGGLPGLGGKVSAAGTAGSVAAASVITFAASGLGIALKGLMAIVKATANAFEEAKKIYSKTMKSGGLPMGMVTQRSAVADAMGVSVEEMDQYANVVAYVGDTFRMSSEMLARTAPALMGMSVNFSALGQDLKALGAELAYMLAPAINTSLIALRGVVLILAKIAEGFNFLFDTIYKGLAGIIELIPGAEVITKAFGDIFRPEPPTPEASTKRLPASAWEKMGLVIGTGAGANYAKDTAANTKRIAEILSGRGSEKPAFNPGGMPMAFNGA